MPVINVKSTAHSIAMKTKATVYFLTSLNNPFLSCFPNSNKNRMVLAVINKFNVNDKLTLVKDSMGIIIVTYYRIALFFHCKGRNIG